MATREPRAVAHQTKWRCHPEHTGHRGPSSLFSGFWDSRWMAQSFRMRRCLMGRNQSTVRKPRPRINQLEVLTHCRGLAGTGRLWFRISSTTILCLYYFFSTPTQVQICVCFVHWEKFKKSSRFFPLSKSNCMIRNKITIHDQKKIKSTFRCHWLIFPMSI